MHNIEYGEKSNPNFIDFHVSVQNYIGQDKSKELMEVSCFAAIQRFEPLDHIMIYSVPNTNSRDFAAAIAADMGTNITYCDFSVVNKSSNFAELVTKLLDGDILLIDEIEEISGINEVVIHDILKNYELNVTLGKGSNARDIKLDINKFTVIGVVHNSKKLSQNIRDDFDIVLKFEPYTVEQIFMIAENEASLLNIELPHDILMNMSELANGNPNSIKLMLKKVRDFYQVIGDYFTLRKIESDPNFFDDVLDKQNLL